MFISTISCARTGVMKQISFSDDAGLLSLGSGCVMGRTEILYVAQSSVNNDGGLTDNASYTSRLVAAGTPTIRGGRVYPDRIPTLYDARTSLSDGHAKSIPFSRTRYT